MAWNDPILFCQSRFRLRFLLLQSFHIFLDYFFRHFEQLRLSFYNVCCINYEFFRLFSPITIRLEGPYVLTDLRTQKSTKICLWRRKNPTLLLNKDTVFSSQEQRFFNVFMSPRCEPMVQNFMLQKCEPFVTDTLHHLLPSCKNSANFNRVFITSYTANYVFSPSSLPSHKPSPFPFYQLKKLK